MDYGMIGKIEKAKRYAEERNRIHFNTFVVTFDGENGQHQIRYDDDGWKCDCNFFSSRGVCSHTMALERILQGMITEESGYAHH